MKIIASILWVFGCAVANVCAAPLEGAVASPMASKVQETNGLDLPKLSSSSGLSEMAIKENEISGKRPLAGDPRH
jgi:hypothetical protein